MFADTIRALYSKEIAAVTGYLLYSLVAGAIRLLH